MRQGCSLPSPVRPAVPLTQKPSPEPALAPSFHLLLPPPLDPFIQIIILFQTKTDPQAVVQLWNCVSLFATPWTVACQASPSSIISWSLFKFISIESVKLSNHLILCCSLLLSPSVFPSIRIFFNESCPTFCILMDCSLPGSPVHGNSPGKNTRVGCHALQGRGIFPTQVSNPGLPHYRQSLYQLSYQRSP